MIVTVILSILGILALGFGMRSQYRSAIKPFQVIGVKLKGEIINASVLKVNEELRTITISHPETKEKIEVALANVYVPSYRE